MKLPKQVRCINNLNSDGEPYRYAKLGEVYYISGETENLYWINFGGGIGTINYPKTKFEVVQDELKYSPSQEGDREDDI